MIFRVTRWVPFSLFMLLLCGFWLGLSLNPRAVPAGQLQGMLPHFKLVQLGHHGFLSSREFRGKFSLLNVWASWCDVCAEEQVFLLKLAKQGVPIYGVNYQDDPAAASAWLAQWGNPYQKVGQDSEGLVATALGIYGTPETFLVDRDGRLLHRHAGALTEKVWRREFLPLMATR